MTTPLADAPLALAGGMPVPDEALVSAADLLRRFHRAAASFDPAGYAWPRAVPARYRTGLVSHNDVSGKVPTWPSAARPSPLGTGS